MKRFLLFFVIFPVLIFNTFALDPGELLGKPWEKTTKEERRAFWVKRTLFTYEPTGKTSSSRLDFYIQVFKNKNIFDPKVIVFDVKAEDVNGTITLRGEVLIPNHRRGVEKTLNTLGFDKIENNIKVLPDPELGEKGFAIADVPLLGMKRSPRKRSEQLNQLSEGAALRLLKSDKTGDYFLVQSSDAYIGWVDAKDIRRMNLRRWSKIREIKKSDKASRKKILKITKAIMGIPYVWGGTSVKGMDCSGLTQYLYQENGINIPRDADEQSNVGELIAFRGYMDNLRAGDLLFYTGGTGRISHVAISLGGSDYIQSTGSAGVHLSSFDPASKYYDKKIAEKFIFARRILRDGF
jgi:NlpC/P60 family protein/dipeptidyl peptidase-like protein